LGDFAGHGDTAAGQAEHDHIIASRVMLQSLGEQLPGFGPICKRSFHGRGFLRPEPNAERTGGKTKSTTQVSR
jgi:hypothetical protein